MQVLLFISRSNSHKHETTTALQVMRELLEQSANQQRLLNLTVIDIDDHPERAAEYKVSTVPCLIIEESRQRREFVGDLSQCKAIIQEVVAESAG